MEFKSHVECFVKLLDEPLVVHLLKRDVCGAICDKYHLVVVFQFFMRADFQPEDYNTKNFFLALSLSHDLYDESKTLKEIIQHIYLSRAECKSLEVFKWEKFMLFKQMQYKGIIDRKICHKLFKLIPHKALQKNRREIHGGVLTSKYVCKKCLCPVNKASNLQEALAVNRRKSDIRLKAKKQKTDRNQFFPYADKSNVFRDKKASVDTSG
ncbi:unnamed protein product [Ceutorhynchus assimilis]|uniref:Uncharacterized protein n=1 Tax=Ceutorhynchus assimilis TaxID=467358 RepID=A0A9N9QH48_9CUCU|nr:unnamed protein product [Ceutorhynchus assimilis]